MNSMLLSMAKPNLFSSQKHTGARLKIMTLHHHNQVIMSLEAPVVAFKIAMDVTLAILATGLGLCSVVTLIHGIMIQTECADAYQMTLNQAIWVVSSQSASMEEHTSQTLRCSTRANSILQTCSEVLWSMMWI